MEIYYKTGKLLELIQLWENEFKLITQKAHIEKSDDKRSLSNMNSFLLRNKIVKEEEYLIIKEVIEIRNTVIHRLFIDDIKKEEVLDNMERSIKKSIEIFKDKNDLLSSLNITAGEELNKKLQNNIGTWVPFNEAMIKGSYNSTLFSEEFCIERSKVHDVSIEVYKEKLTLFLSVLPRLNEFKEIILWFGDEPFCQENTKIVIETLKQYKYKGLITLNIVDEIKGTILETKEISI